MLQYDRVRLIWRLTLLDEARCRCSHTLREEPIDVANGPE